VPESNIVNYWINIGEARGQLLTMRFMLVRAIALRLENPVPEPIDAAIKNTKEIGKLLEWFRAVMLAETIADLRKAMKLELDCAAA
jgi:hypothetical protein